MLQSESRGHRSYLEAFARRRNLTPDVLSTENLLTDRDAYLNFLEVQLERVSAACLTAHEYGTKVESLAKRTSSAEEKVLSTTKLVRLAQTYSEEQGREQARINDAFEDRMANLERRLVDSRDASPPENCRRFPPEGDEVASSRLLQSPPDSPISPGLLTESAAGLSNWMWGVEQRLEDLHAKVASSLKECETPAVTKPDGGESSLDERGTACGESGEEVEGAYRPSAETASTSPPRAQNQSRTVEWLAAPELAEIEERLRRLEEGANTTVASTSNEAQRNSEAGVSSGEEPGVQKRSRSDRGKRSKRSPELAGRVSPLSPTSSPRRNAAFSPVQSCTPGPPNAADAAIGAESSHDVIVGEAVKEGTAEARRATELAEEALKIGREAAERSERTENLAKSLAAKSTKLAEDQRDQVNEALNRLLTTCNRAGATHRANHAPRPTCAPKPNPLVKTESAPRNGIEENEQLRRNHTNSTSDEEGRQPFLDKAWVDERSAVTCREAATSPEDYSHHPAGSAGCGATAVARVDMESECTAAADPRAAGDVLNRVHGRVRQRPTEVSPTRRRIQAPSLTAGHRERSRTRAGADARSVTFSRCPTRDIPGIVEGKPTDSVNSRPEAHGAARMALESVLQEVSPHKAEYEAEMSVARRSRALPAGSRKGGASHVDPRKVDEMRQAIQGAVRILAGISGSHTPREKQHRLSRSARRGSRRGMPSSRSRERVKSSPMRDRCHRNEHMGGGNWIPPGNIPCKMGERRGRVLSVRTRRDRREDKAEEEKVGCC